MTVLPSAWPIRVSAVATPTGSASDQVATRRSSPRLMGFEPSTFCMASRCHSRLRRRLSALEVGSSRLAAVSRLRHSTPFTGSVRTESGLAHGMIETGGGDPQRTRWIIPGSIQGRERPVNRLPADRSLEGRDPGAVGTEFGGGKASSAWALAWRRSTAARIETAAPRGCCTKPVRPGAGPSRGAGWGRDGRGRRGRRSGAAVACMQRTSGGRPAGSARPLTSALQ